MPLYSAFLGCSRSMELWLITSVWPASCSALCANTHACWKGSYSFMLVQQKAITTHMREYASAAENSKQHTSMFIVGIAYSLILYNMEEGCGFSIVGKYGKSLLPSSSCKQMLPNHLCKHCEVFWLKCNTELFHILICSGFQFVNSLNADRSILWKGWLRAKSHG